MTQALILFAHGARDPAWAEPLRRVRAAMRELAPAQAVEMAFLELLSPTLDECAASLIADGATRIRIVPMFLARSGHLQRDLPDRLHTLRATYPQIEFTSADAIGEHERVIRALAEVALLACAD